MEKITATIKFQECSSFCYYILQTLLQFLFTTFKVWSKSNNSYAGTPKASTPKTFSDQNVQNKNKILKGEVEMVMGKLGISYDPDGLDEIETLFDANEPSMEEVREAFDVFDENNDEFIDTEELEKLLCCLGFGEVSKVKCKIMIEAFDDNGDGRIGFDEFVKVVEQSFC